MTKTTIYLTRHGQTEWNVAKKMQGHQDSALTAQGVLQATWLRDAMLTMDLAAIYSSTSPRAMTTAEIIRGQRPLKIITDDALREIHMGDWEGRTRSEILQTDAQGMASFSQQPAEYIPNHQGESFDAVLKRVIPALHEIIAQHPEQTILIVSHGITLRLILSYFEQRPLTELWSSPFMQPTALSKVVVEDNKTTIELYGDVSHYKDPAPEQVQNRK